MKKQVKPRTVEKQMVVVRRSSRVTTLPAPDYRDVAAEHNLMPSFMVTRQRTYKLRDTSGGLVHVSAEASEYAFGKAEELESTLGTSCPTLGLPSHFCKTKLPKYDGAMTFVSEEDGLSRGWKGFAQSQDLADGDALVFQLTKPTTMKVYIINISGFYENNYP